MKSILALLTLSLALPALAETATYQIQGMHCGACSKSIEESVCKMPGLTACKAKLTNAKKQKGELTITTADGTPIDTAKIEELLGQAGDYKMVKSSKK